MPDYQTEIRAVEARVHDVAADLEVWIDRAEPDARARGYASDAIDAIDAAIGKLYDVRARLISEIRHADDETAKRAEARFDHPDREV